jgi:hypothetical protein
MKKTRIQAIVDSVLKEAEKTEIQDEISMTPNQRLKIVHSLRVRIFGRSAVDIRRYHKQA